MAGTAALGALLGPPSLHWVEEGLAKADQAILQATQPVTQAWVPPDVRSSSLSAASDGIFYVIQSFFKRELAKLKAHLQHQSKTTGSAAKTAQQVVQDYDWSAWRKSFVPQLAQQIENAYQSGLQDTKQILQGRGIAPQKHLPEPGKQLLLPAPAKQYAKGRSGELVGMHINSDGSLVPSKRPDMRIDEDTRKALESWLEQELKDGKDWIQIGNDLVSQSGEIGFPQMQDWRARRIGRTEASIAYNRGQIQTARDAGATKVEVFDGTQDEICAPVNHQIWTLEEAENDPLGHPNCSRSFSLILE